MIRVVFDTMVFVRSAINPFGLWGRLLFHHRASYTFYLSLELRDEIADVLNRPEVKRKFRRFTPTVAAVFAAALDDGVLIETPDILPISRDPKDDKVLAVAKASQADYLVSEDNDLLVLGEYSGTQIITAAHFMDLLLSKNSEV